MIRKKTKKDEKNRHVVQDTGYFPHISVADMVLHNAAENNINRTAFGKKIDTFRIKKETAEITWADTKKMGSLENLILTRFIKRKNNNSTEGVNYLTRLCEETNTQIFSRSACDI